MNLTLSIYIGDKLKFIYNWLSLNLSINNNTINQENIDELNNSLNNQNNDNNNLNPSLKKDYQKMLSTFGIKGINNNNINNENNDIPKSLSSSLSRNSVSNTSSSGINPLSIKMKWISL